MRVGVFVFSMPWQSLLPTSDGPTSDGRQSFTILTLRNIRIPFTPATTTTRSRTAGMTAYNERSSPMTLQCSLVWAHWSGAWDTLWTRTPADPLL